MTQTCRATHDMSLVSSTASPVFVQASLEKGFAIDFLMGGISATVSKTTVAPIERVKLLIQNQDEMLKAGRLSEPYKGIQDCFSRTVKEEGFGSLLRGNIANDYFKRLFNFKKNYDGYWKWFAGNLASGGTVGASSLLFAAKKGGERQFNGLVNVYSKTHKSDGIAWLYRGFNISYVGIIVYRGVYFGMYDSFKPMLLIGKQHDSFFASFALGWVITNGAGLASYPIDTVRRRMMMTSGETVKYKSSMDAFSQILKNEGVKSLFKGADANILHAIAGAGVLASYDKLKMLVLGKKIILGVVDKEEEKIDKLRGGAANLGAIVRDDSGIPRVAASWFYKEVLDVELKEALALLEGLKMTTSWFYKEVLDVELKEALALLEGTSSHQIQQLRGGAAGLGAIVRDDSGIPRVAASWFYKEVLDVELKEALALLEGVAT
ncbi:hypothetical protein ACOSQ2_004732 [Xanthoceras sorbifolium]